MNIYEFLQTELSLSKEEIREFSLLAPNKYKIYKIPKKTIGSRTIAHPSKELKRYQRALNILLDAKLPIHDVAFAYRKNISIKNNANQHRKSKYLLKMDFQNFFHSITPELLFKCFEKLDIEISRENKHLLTKLVFWRPSKRSSGKLILSIGAPCSPIISNFIMYAFDEELAEICKDLKITYTRYADDITFSTNQDSVLFQIPKIVKKLLASTLYGSISINEKKTVFTSKAHNRHVTGVTITNDEKLSLGRTRKRYISSLIHKFTLNQLEDDEVDYLRGLLAFAKNIEPVFETRMTKKYTAVIMAKINNYTSEI